MLKRHRCRIDFNEINDAAQMARGKLTNEHQPANRIVRRYPHELYAASQTSTIYQPSNLLLLYFCCSSFHLSPLSSCILDDSFSLSAHNELKQTGACMLSPTINAHKHQYMCSLICVSACLLVSSTVQSFGLLCSPEKHCIA